MKNVKAISHQRVDDLINEFQKSLSDTVLLLLELKGEYKITRAQRKEIDDLVEKLHEYVVDLPKIMEHPKHFELVFGTIQRIWNFWQNVFS